MDHPIGVPGLRWAEIDLGDHYDQAVVCEYRYDEASGQLTCNTIMTLDRPL